MSWSENAPPGGHIYYVSQSDPPTVVCLDAVDLEHYPILNERELVIVEALLRLVARRVMKHLISKELAP